MTVPFDVVVPTIGRPSFATLLGSLAAAAGPPPERILVVDDRPTAVEPLPLGESGGGRLAERIKILRGMGAGPAAARNLGWRAASAPWVAFLDDDVVVGGDWLERLHADLAGLGKDVAGSQGRIEVPLPSNRRATDWERDVAGLRTARWATADLAYRRVALAAVGGFATCFRRAYREDADLGLRLLDRGWRIAVGSRKVQHPVGPASPWVSVQRQAGNADDPVMAARHGPGWMQRAGVPRGRRPRHLAVCAAGLLGMAGVATGSRLLARLGLAAYALGVTELAVARIRPGPGDRREVARMLATSALLPLAAAFAWVRGLLRTTTVGSTRPLPQPRPEVVLLDRDDTLVVDVPYNGDPARVVPVEGARAALDRLRAAGVRVAVVSNQSGVARGLLTPARVEAVNARVDELLGPFEGFFVCHHGTGEGCGCRKPEPGLITAAAAALGVEASGCAVVGDIGADVEAAVAAGARGVMVPTERTLLDELERATEVAPTLAAAADLLLGGAPAAFSRPASSRSDEFPAVRTGSPSARRTRS